MVHDALLGVMTDAPTYDWHMTNLNTYLNLSPKDVEEAKLGPVTLEAFGSARHARRLHAAVPVCPRLDLQSGRDAERYRQGCSAFGSIFPRAP